MTCSRTGSVITIVLLNCYLICFLSHFLIAASISFPEPSIEDKDYALSYNLVEPTTPSFRAFWNLYSKHSKTPSPVKSIVKALNIWDTKLKKSSLKSSSSVKPTNLSTSTGAPLNDAEKRNSPQIRITLHDDRTRTSAPVIVPLNNDRKKTLPVGAVINRAQTRTSLLVATSLNDAQVRNITSVGALLNVTKSTTPKPFRAALFDLWDTTMKDLPHSELDKSKRFTHSILYGYGLEH